MESRDSLKKQIREWIKLGFIEPKDIPSIELYMDQVTTFMDKYLAANKRTEEDKTLTKTMINNYTKNDLLPPPNKKRYSKEHLILLIYIYYLKNVISINDIQTMLTPLIDEYFDNNVPGHSLPEIYANLYELEKYQYFNVESSIIKAHQLSTKDDFSKDDAYLQKLNFLSLLCYDIFTKRKLMEQIIDEMKAEADAMSEAKQTKEKSAKQPVKQANKPTGREAKKTAAKPSAKQPHSSSAKQPKK